MIENKTILLVDDDAGHRTMLKANLSAAGYQIVEAEDGDQVLPIIEDTSIDFILLDLKMKRMDGLETLQAIKQAGYYLPIVVLTAFSSVDSAVRAMKEGAFDYITKPVDIEELKILLNRALDFDQLQKENLLLKKRLNEKFQFGNIIGHSKPMRELFETLALVAPSDANILIHGESGSGKELVANVLHENSQRKKGPFIAVNCAALHENLLESELFGHEKGAFTGATGIRVGRFEQAHTGTLFLDEIGDMSLATQAKILRVLQEGAFERVGGDKTIKVDVRIVTASHKDLDKLVEEGSFRQDLFYRLNVVPITLPPLRDRKEDIPALAEYFLKQFAQKNRKGIQGFHPASLANLVHYDWPGNIRELQNAIERAVILCLGELIMPNDLPSNVSVHIEGSELVTPEIPTGTSLRDMERQLIHYTLKQTSGNKTQTANILGIARQTLQNKMKEYDLK
jgi:DNA-binding NtrC family response regulator